jgi:hypothetical protein
MSRVQPLADATLPAEIRRLERSAVFRGWRVPEVVRRRVLAQAALDLRSEDPEVRHRASQVILRCVAQDIALERVASVERTGRLQAQATALGAAYAAALADPRFRELLRQMDATLVEGTAQSVAPPTDAGSLGPRPR